MGGGDIFFLSFPYVDLFVFFERFFFQMFSECVWTLMCIIFALFLLISLLVDNGNQRQPQAVNKNFGISCDKKIGPTK